MPGDQPPTGSEVPHSKWRVFFSAGAGWGLVLVGGLLGIYTAFLALGNSLWLDELHTAWAATGPVGEVLPRAALGNQLPLYSWLQWLVSQTVGQSELSLRTSSLMAWLGALLFLAWQLQRFASATGRWFVFALVAFVALDRNQHFYATEARPYALLALVNVLAWWQLARLVADLHSRTIARCWRRIFFWLGLNTLAFWLQPVIVLAWIAQLLMLLIVWFHAPRKLVNRRAGQLMLIAGMAMALVAWPAWFILQNTWQSRGAWSAFAANIRIGNVLGQLPIVAVAGPVGLAMLIRVIVIKRTEPKATDRLDEMPWTNHWLWLCAWLIPLGLVVLSTASGFAPLMHPRYLFASSVPLVLWSASIMSGWSNKCGWITVAAMLVTLTAQQGSMTAWRYGQWASPVRREAWRELHLKIIEAGDPQPLVFCASNLIEGNLNYSPTNHSPTNHSPTNYSPTRKRGVLNSSILLDAYLSLPLQSLYRPGDQAQVIALPNDPRLWRETIEPWTVGRRHWWLAVRCSSTTIAGRLEQARLQPARTIDFGGVQLLRFQE